MKQKWKREYLAVILFICAVFMSSCTVFASEQISGIDIYMIPQGEQGIENGKFWLYTEILDANGKNISGDNWTVELKVINTENMAQDEAELERFDKSGGYFHSPVELISEMDYEEYEIHIRVIEEENILKERSTKASECILNWPKLKSDEWKKTIEFSEKPEDLMYGFEFDWNDTALFSRLFNVSVENQPENLIIQPDEENQVWKMSVTKPVSETMNIILIDAAGNRQSIPYSIQIEKNYIDPVVLKFLLLCAVCVAILVWVIWKRKKISKEESEERGSKPIENPSLTEKSNLLYEAKENLDESLRQLRNAQKQLILKIQSNESEIRNLENCDMYLQILRQENFEIPELSFDENSYHEAKKKLEDFFNTSSKQNDIQWKLQDTQVYFDEIIKNLGDDKKIIETEIERIRMEQNNLEGKLQELRNQKEEMRKLLGMHVFVSVCLGEKKYRIAKSAMDKGFSLDEEMLHEHYRSVGKKFHELVGEKTGIRISAKDGKYIVVECSSGNLYMGDTVINRMEIPVHSRKKIGYIKQDHESLITLEIETR